jgi:hypothetical protein
VADLPLFRWANGARPRTWTDPQTGKVFDFRAWSLVQITHSLELPGCKKAEMGGALYLMFAGETPQQAHTRGPVYSLS